MIRTSVVKELKCFIAWNKDISIALFHCSTVKVSLPTGNWSLQQKKNKIDLFNAVICKFLITLFTFDLKVPYVKPKSLILCCQKLSRLVFFTGRLDKNRPIPFPIRPISHVKASNLLLTLLQLLIWYISKKYQVAPNTKQAFTNKCHYYSNTWKQSSSFWHANLLKIY